MAKKPKAVKEAYTAVKCGDQDNYPIPPPSHLSAQFGDHDEDVILEYIEQRVQEAVDKKSSSPGAERLRKILAK